MRVFAGPNGSGKSSIIESILNTKLSRSKKLDFGVYINADDIEVLLKKSLINFTKFKVEARKDDLLEVANRSGLVNKDFSLERLEDCIVVKK
jgi:predicted ABC-type ATPase